MSDPITNMQLTDEFTAAPLILAGQKLHPYSFGRRELLARIGNEMLSGKQMNEMAEPMFAVAEFLYILVPEMEEVMALVEDREKWRKAVILFADKLSPTLEKESAIAVEVLRRANMAEVRVEPKPPIEGAKPETPPPNS